MKTSKDYKDLILEQLDLLDNIDNREKLKEIVIETCRDLSSKK